MVQVKVGSQTFKFSVETGSSDTWLAQTDFECINLTTGGTQPEADCHFGKLYNHSSSFSQITDENFKITYASGETLMGTLGRTAGRLASITVDNQEIAAVTAAAWGGDGLSTRIMGLAFPAITSAFQGTNPALDSPSTQVNPIRSSATCSLRERLLRCSVWPSLEDKRRPTRNRRIPNVAHTGSLVSAPFQILTIQSQSAPSDGTKIFQFYAITLQGFEIAN